VQIWGRKNLRDILYKPLAAAEVVRRACNQNQCSMQGVLRTIKANGKTGKQVLIALCNKLMKQIFAVVKNNTLYQPNYCSAKP
jgi:hypothetical protein